MDKVVILCLLSITNVQLISSYSYYTAAVVEYNPITVNRMGREDLIPILNADNYLKFMRTAKEYDVDIIVFPESSLSPPRKRNDNFRDYERSSYMPDPEEHVIICNDLSGIYNQVLKTISCEAMRLQMYVVINHLEKVDCPYQDCATDGLLYYNSNLVFDRRGKVIAKYRKYNLFNEPGLDITSEPIISVFKTDFGVTFAQFICFDILFEKPTLNYIREMNVTDIVFSSRWFHEVPFFVSTSIQQAWAYANDVNLLASGYNHPASGSSGSGIYAGNQGYIQTFISNGRSSVLIVAKVPKVINGNRGEINPERSLTYNFGYKEKNEMMGGFIQPWHFNTENLDRFSSLDVDVYRAGLYQKSLCNNGMCCYFELYTTFNHSVTFNNGTAVDYYKYKMIAYSGKRGLSPLFSNNKYTFGISLCALLSCTNDSLASCSDVFNPNKRIAKPITFESLKITKYTTSNQDLTMPITTLTDMDPLDGYQFISDCNSTICSLELLEPRNDLKTFALYNRHFADDKYEEMPADYEDENSIRTDWLIKSSCSVVYPCFLVNCIMLSFIFRTIC